MPRNKLGKSCKLWFCNDAHYANRMCVRHYAIKRKYGSVISPKNTDLKNVLRALDCLIDAIARRVDQEEYDADVWGIIHSVNESKSINAVERCPVCKMDRIATLYWPHVTISCGCKEEEVISVDR